MIIGIGIASFLLLYFAFNLDKEHYLLKLLAAFFFLSILILIPKSLIDDKNFCEIVVSNTTYFNTTNSTTYEYERFCETNPKTTTRIFYNSLLWFYRIFMIYVFIYFTYVVFFKRGLKQTINDVKRGGNKLFKKR